MINLTLANCSESFKCIRGGMSAGNSSTWCGWYDAPSYMQLLDGNSRVMIRDCGSGGDCLFSSIVYALSENGIYDDRNVPWTVMTLRFRLARYSLPLPLFL